MEGSWGDSTGPIVSSYLCPTSPACWQPPWAPPQPCWVCLLDSTLGVPTPSLWLWLRACTHHAPVGDTQVLGLPWHTAADHRSPPRGATHHKDCGSTDQSSRGGRQAVERARCAPAGLHILKHQLTTSFLCHRKCLYRNQTTERSKV